MLHPRLSILPLTVSLALAITASIATTARAQRDLTDIPEPDPAAEMAAMRVDPAMRVNLFAADPQIRKPIQSNFDSLGRLWVASSESYPQLAPGEVANDKIIVLEDTDGDGVAETSTVFADGLLIPTGVLPDGTDAAYVAHATELLHLRDTDGDGRADQRRVVLSGFGTEDTHHLIHTLRWGFDGCLYFNQSIYIHTTVETAYGTRRLDGGGIWRYRPETGELAVFCKGFVNPWGHTFDAYGQSLATDGAYFEGINHVFPDAVFVTSPGAPRWIGGMNPGSPKHCGLTILSGDHVPADWQGDLVTNDFRSHRVCRFTIRPEGSSYQSRQQPEIITSSHIAFRPIDAAIGGDGALYIADWSNPIIQHGEVDFRDERRDRSSGRIWRVSFDGRPLATRPDYANLDTASLVALLRDSGLTVRQFARLELKRRDPAEVRATVAGWVDAADDASEREHRAMEAMWIDECLNAPNPERIAQVLSAEDGRIRAAAVRVIGHRRDGLDDSRAMLAAAVADPHPQVRLETVAALGRGDSAADAELALVALDQPLDTNLDFALWNTVRQLAPFWAPRLAEGTFDFGGQPRRLEFLLSAAGSPAAAAPVLQAILGEPGPMTLDDAQAAALVVPVSGMADAGQVAQLVRAVLQRRQWDATLRAELLSGLVEQTTRRGLRPDGLDQELGQSLAQALDESSGPLTDALVGAAGAWKVAAAVPVLQRRVTAATGPNAPAPDAPENGEPEASETSGGDASTGNMIRALGQIGTPQASEFLASLSAEQSVPPTHRAVAVVALSATQSDAAIQAFTLLLGQDTTRGAMIERTGELLARKEIPEKVTAALRDQTLPPDDARRLVSIARGAAAPEGLIDAIRAAGRLEEAGWKWSESLRDSILAMAAEQGSAARGEAIYRRASLQCVNCHSIGSGGSEVGPNLVSLGGGSTPEYILQSLIEPNDKLKEGFNTVRVLTVDGRVIQGIPAGGDQDTLRLRTADGTIAEIATADIEEQGNGQSLMPVGLVDVMTKQELADLTRFLSELGRTPEYTVSTKGLVRAVDTLLLTDRANQVMNRTSTDAVASGDPAFEWSRLTSRVDGTFPVEEMAKFQQHQGVPPTSYIRFELEVGEAPFGGLAIEPSEGIEMWVDGRPTPAWQASDMDLGPGKHTIILGIDRSKITDAIQIEIREPREKP